MHAYYGDGHELKCLRQGCHNRRYGALLSTFNRAAGLDSREAMPVCSRRCAYDVLRAHGVVLVDTVN